mmetsp:Transcript_2940/g.5851  ORF Transcript_2940/g.5851 Transcript_2940/m.5851 type:complete len:109 (-) Transcript_2940:351-677(-)
MNCYARKTKLTLYLIFCNQIFLFASFKSVFNVFCYFFSLDDMPLSPHHAPSCPKFCRLYLSVDSEFILFRLTPQLIQFWLLSLVHFSKLKNSDAFHCRGKCRKHQSWT